MRFVYRHLVVLGPESARAAEAAECAGEQGKFWEYHDMLFENLRGEGVGAFSDANLKAFAPRLRLAEEQFAACLDGRKYASRVMEDTQAARALDIRSTPTVLVNGLRLVGLADYGTYRRAIEEALRNVR